jgi:hypothetical protein
MIKPFNPGPFTIKYKPYEPIHFLPPNEEPKKTKPKFKWLPFPNKPNIIKNLDERQKLIL